MEKNISKQKRIAIIGAGIAGLSCAVRLIEEHPHADVTVIADTFSPDTCSDGAAGLWRPFSLSDTPDELITRWSVPTWYLLNDLLRRPDHHRLGLSTAFAYELSDSDSQPGWIAAIPGQRKATKEELKHIFHSKANYGTCGPTIMCEFSKFSGYLTDRYQSMGGKIRRGRVNKLTDLADDFDIVINCAGHGAAKLCNDEQCFTLRGHILRMKAPWLRNVTLYASKDCEDCVYIIPNNEFIVVGGTKARNNSSTIPKREDRDKILARAIEIEPSLKGAEFLSEWVGLRPARDTVRLEREDILVPGKNKTLKLIHNYGLGGAGLTIAWGCAIDVVDLVTACLREEESSIVGDRALQSKL